MLAINKILPQGRGLAAALLRRAPTLTLDWDTRSRSRFDATDSAGRALGLFLPRGSVLRGGDVLVAEDGSLVRVQAAPQPVLRVAACGEHGTPADLARAAYHLGNRHVAVEVQADHLKIEPDHVLAEMLRRMHLVVTAADDAFEPEGGAYQGGGPAQGHAHAAGHAPHDHGGGPGQGHEHGHAHDHSADHPHHGHGHDHGHGHGPADHGSAAAPARAAAPHVHGPGCGHGHGFDAGAR